MKSRSNDYMIRALNRLASVAHLCWRSDVVQSEALIPADRERLASQNASARRKRSKMHPHSEDGRDAKVSST